MSAAKMELVSKLSLKKIIGKVDVKALHEAAKENPNVEIELFNIGGTCTGTKTGNTTFGEFCAFIGSFAAIRLADGVIFRGPQLFLPTVAEAFVRPTVDKASGNPVEFAFIIGVKPMTKPSGEMSYEYTVKPIIAPDTVDPLAEMIAKLQVMPRLIGSTIVNIGVIEAHAESEAETQPEPEASTEPEPDAEKPRARGKKHESE